MIIHLDTSDLFRDKTRRWLTALLLLWLHAFIALSKLTWLSTSKDESDKPVTSVFLISQHRKSYKPSKNGAICASAYLLCAQRFYRLAVFDRTFVHALIALCVFALQIARAQKSYVPTLSQIQSYIVHKGSICSDSTFVHYNIWLYKYLTLFCLALLKVTRFYQ